MSDPLSSLRWTAIYSEFNTYTSSVESPRGYDGKNGVNKKTIGFMRTCSPVLTAILLKYTANDIISFRGR